MRRFSAPLALLPAACSGGGEGRIEGRVTWQGRGIGAFIMKHLTNIAKRNGIAGFTAEVLTGNKPMQAVLDHSNTKVRRSHGDGVFHYDLDF